MRKLAVVIDSFSGLYKSDVEKNENIFFLSLQFEIDGILIDEGIEVPSQDLINKIRNGSKTSTSLPKLDLIQNTIKKLSKEYENVIFLPLPKTMSGTCDTLMAFSKKYNNVTVIENHFIGITYLEVAKHAIKMIENNINIKEIISFIKTTNENTIGFVIPNELKSLIASGRLKGIKKHVIASGNLSLILKIYSKLSVSGIARSKKSAVKKVFSKLDKFCSENPLFDGYLYKVVYGYEDTFLKITKDYMKEIFIELANEMKTSLSTFSHTGYGSIYIGVTPKLN